MLAALIQGELQYDEVHDCFLVAPAETDVAYPVVWPSGTLSLADEIGVQLPSGDRVTVGDTISGGGGYFNAPTAYDIPAECVPPLGDVAVFNPTEPVDVNATGG
jgi:hypothetical protein